MYTVSSDDQLYIRVILHHCFIVEVVTMLYDKTLQDKLYKLIGLALGNRRMAKNFPIEHLRFNSVHLHHIEQGLFRGTKKDPFTWKMLLDIAGSFDIEDFPALCPIVADSEAIDVRIEQEEQFRNQHFPIATESAADRDLNVCKYIGNLIRLHRESLGMTQAAVAGSVEMPLDQLQAIEEEGAIGQCQFSDLLMFINVLQIESFPSLWPQKVADSVKILDLDRISQARKKILELMALVFLNRAREKEEEAFLVEVIYKEKFSREFAIQKINVDKDLFLYKLFLQRKTDMPDIFKLLNRLEISDFSALCPFTFDLSLLDKRIKEEEELRSKFDSA